MILGTYCRAEDPQQYQGTYPSVAKSRIYSKDSFHTRKAFCCLDCEPKRSVFCAQSPGSACSQTELKLSQVVSAILSIKTGVLLVSPFLLNVLLNCRCNCTNDLSLIHVACILNTNISSTDTVA